jgi:hypothetical protein
LESELPRSRNSSPRSGCQTSRRICILRHLCHVESEKQTDIQVAGLCERPRVSCSCRGQCSPSANNNMSKSSRKYIHKRPAVTRFCALVGAPFSGLSMRIFLLRARSTSPHTSMFVRHTPLGLSRKGWVSPSAKFRSWGKRTHTTTCWSTKGRPRLSLTFSFIFVLLHH